MASIGIIANPASGKDIRRLVSYATTIDNNEKVNICKRIVLAAQGLGVESAYFMPETFMIGYAVKDSLESDGVLSLSLAVLDFEIEAAMEDTVRSARMLEKLGVGCIVVLGGDGKRLAAFDDLHDDGFGILFGNGDDLEPRIGFHRRADVVKIEKDGTAVDIAVQFLFERLRGSRAPLGISAESGAHIRHGKNGVHPRRNDRDEQNERYDCCDDRLLLHL